MCPHVGPDSQVLRAGAMPGPVGRKPDRLLWRNRLHFLGLEQRSSKPGNPSYLLKFFQQ